MTPEPIHAAASDLESLARTQFTSPPLTEAETKLVQNASKGEVAICGPSLNPNDALNDPSRAESWGAERQIRAELIRWLCVDRRAKELVDPRGIQLYAANISRGLDLYCVTVPFPLVFERCRLYGELNLRCANLIGINFPGTWVDSIGADGAQVKTSVFLRNGFHAKGEVRLPVVRIGGTLECDGGTFENPARPGNPYSGRAITADGAIVEGAVFLRSGFSAVGEVRLVGAQIGGNLDCTNATIKNPFKDRVESSGIALHADGILVKGAVYLGAGFRAEGEVRMQSAQVGSAFECSGGTFIDPPQEHGGGHALTADRAVVRGDVLFAVIPGDVAVQRFRAEGEVRVLGARIGGDLSCIGGVFINPPIPPLDASNRALSAHTVTVEGHVFLRDGFHSEGEVSFTDARLSGNLECTGGSFHDLTLQGASVKGALFWRNIVDPERLRLDLTNASFGALADDLQGWPGKGKLLLDGLVYERFSGGAPKDAKRRLDWVARQKSFVPQPYQQLAKVLRAEGMQWDAQRVLFEMERVRRREADRGWLARSWSFLQRVTVGYGYYPTVPALRSLALLVLVGSVVLWGGSKAGSIVPSEKDAYASFVGEHRLPDHYERFQPLVFSFENSFPLVKLGQADRWQPDPVTRRVPIPGERRMTRLYDKFVSPGFLRWFLRTQIVLGWFFATMGLAGVTGIVRKD